MRKLLFVFTPLLLIVVFLLEKKLAGQRNSGAPPYATEDLAPPTVDSISWLRDWDRPDGPPKVALQVGHWKNNELPDELERFRGNSGASGVGFAEWEVNLAIAEAAAEILKEKQIVVEILPATIPPRFWADVFVAIHADGSTNTSISGFKAGTPRHDYSGKAEKLLSLLEKEYQEATGFAKDPNVTRNMRGYYAFAWWRYEHALHPMTTSIILETGFLTSPKDRKIIVDQPEVVAEGVARGIIKYLESEGLIEL